MQKKNYLFSLLTFFVFSSPILAQQKMDTAANINNLLKQLTPEEKVCTALNGRNFEYQSEDSFLISKMVVGYIKQRSSLPRPEKELKAFDKIFLQPGETKTVKLLLDENAFHYYSDIENKWVMESGVFDIMVGSPSRMIKLNSKIKL